MVADTQKWLAVFFGVAFSLLLIAMMTLPFGTANKLTGEAGPVEGFAAIAYLVGAVAALVASWRARGIARLNFVVWSFLALLFFGEETSYLQHWIGYATPVWIEALNAQGELNIHNLDPLQGGSLLDDKANISSLLKSQNLFRIGFFGYFLVLPLVYRFSARARNRISEWAIPLPGRRILTAAWVLICLSLVFRLLGGEASPIAEVRETIYASTIGLFLIAHWQRSRGIVR